MKNYCVLELVQKELIPWQSHNFPNRPSYQPLLGAVEELGELAHAHLKEIQNIRNNENHIENAKDAVADIIIFLADYCNSRDFNLSQIVENTWKEVSKRDWRK